MKKCMMFFQLVLVATLFGCGGMVENTKPMLVHRYDRMKLENTMMYAVVPGDYNQAKAHADRVMKEQGYGKHLHDLPEYKMFVYGKEEEHIEPQYKAAKDSIRVVLRFFPRRDGTTKIEMMNSSRVRGLSHIVDQDMPRMVKALSQQ